MPIKTLEQIDEELEKEFFSKSQEGQEDEEDIEDNDDLEVEIVESDGEEDDDSDDDKDESKEKEEVKVDSTKVETTPKVDPKQEFAWKEMRTKQQKLQEELKQKEEFLSKIEKMAKGLGYTSSEELIKKFDEEETVKEAKEKNVDPTFYKEFKQMQQELQLTKQEKDSQFRQSKIISFTDTLDSLIKENGLTDKEKETIISELESDGYTIDDIINIKSPKKLLAGYMVDKIAEKKVQSKLKQQKQAFKDEKHDNIEDLTDDDLEKQLKEEMAQYARERGYKV